MFGFRDYVLEKYGITDWSRISYFSGAAGAGSNVGGMLYSTTESSEELLWQREINGDTSTAGARAQHLMPQEQEELQSV